MRLLVRAAFAILAMTALVGASVGVQQTKAEAYYYSHGYWLVGTDGGVFAFGDAKFYGSTGSLHLQRPVVGIVTNAGNSGYWLVASDGGVFAYGNNTTFYGSIPGLGIHPAGSGQPDSLDAPIVGIVPTDEDNGYFMVGSDGGVFAFGAATFEGSCPGIGGCSGTAVAVVPWSGGNGYWLVTSTGNVYAFGAPNYGAPGVQSSSITSAAGDPSNVGNGLVVGGYWIVDADGQVFNYGNAYPSGSVPAGQAGGPNPATAIFAENNNAFDSGGGGYWVATANGNVFPFGGAPSDGNMLGTALNGRIIAGAGF